MNDPRDTADAGRGNDSEDRPAVTDGAGGQSDDGERAPAPPDPPMVEDTALPDDVGGSDGPNPGEINWREFFPYDTPYDQQADGAETILNAAVEDGYALIEGACGTGKTLMALCAGLALVDNSNSRFTRVLCVTPVKQQLRAFEDDLEAINANGPEIDALTMVGKADLCSYVDAGTIDPAKTDFYDTCADAREAVREIATERAEEDQEMDYATLQRITGSWKTGPTTPGLHADGDWATDYQPDGPSREDPHEYDDDGNRHYPPDAADQTGCPFYAKWLLENMDDDTPEPLPSLFSGVARADEVLTQVSEQGMCPHAAMTAAIERADVLVGNYYHLYDDTTYHALLDEYVGEDTFLIVDEAHRLEPKIRTLSHEDRTDRNLRQLRERLDKLLLDPASGSIGEDVRRVVQEVLNNVDSGVNVGDSTPDDPSPPSSAEPTLSANALTPAREVAAAVDAFTDAVDAVGRAALEEEIGPEAVENIGGIGMWNLPKEVEYPLRPPDAEQTDTITQALSDTPAGDPDEVLALAETVQKALKTAEDRQPGFNGAEGRVRKAGEFIHLWQQRDKVDYLRQIRLTRKREPDAEAEGWRRFYDATLEVKNCLPADPISERLDMLGGGVLMSATMEPLEEYERVIGVGQLENRPVTRATYGMHFPEENRESIIAETPRFVWSNRGPAPTPPDGRADGISINPEPMPPPNPADSDDSEHARVRKQYVEVTAGVARSPGNVVVGMPSYSEAAWMASVLQHEVDKSVLLDQSSSDAATERLKQRFFSGNAKVLVTSMRGTLTEGVDYDGDKLHGCVVCGVPIRNSRSDHAEAIKFAYERRLGDGFKRAFGDPAVRRARQTIGRVVRNPGEVGVRVLADERYAWGGGYVREALSAGQRREFTAIPSGHVGPRTEAFWRRQDMWMPDD